MRVLTVGNRFPPHGTGGYERVWGPNARTTSPAGSYLVIERYNGVLGIRDELVSQFSALPTRRSDVNIKVDPLGYGCGPKYGRYTRAIPSSAMGVGQTYPTPASLVQAIVAAFGKAGIAW